MEKLKDSYRVNCENPSQNFKKQVGKLDTRTRIIKFADGTKIKQEKARGLVIFGIKLW